LALAGDPRKRLGLLDYFPITQIPHLIDYVRLEKVLPRVRCVHSRPLRCKLLWLHGSSACADRVSLANPYFFKLQRSPLGRASLAPERRTYLQHPHRQHVSMYNAAVPLGRASVARTRRLHCLLRIRKSDHGSVTVAGWNLATH